MFAVRQMRNSHMVMYTQQAVADAVAVKVENATATIARTTIARAMAEAEAEAELAAAVANFLLTSIRVQRNPHLSMRGISP